MIEKLKLHDNIQYPYIDEDGVSHESKTDYIKYEILHLCSCGFPDLEMLYIRDFLQKLANKEWGDNKDMPYIFLCNWANNEGYADHGMNIANSLLTDKGRELLNDINWCIENEKDSDDNQ